MPVVSVRRQSVVHLLGCELKEGTTGVHAVNSTVVSVDTVVSDMRKAVPAPGHGPVSNKVDLCGGEGDAYMLTGGSVRIVRGRVHRCDSGVFVRGGPSASAWMTADVSGTVFETDLLGMTAEDACIVTVTECEFLGPLCERSAQSPHDVNTPPEAMGVLCLGDKRVSMVGCSFDGFGCSVQAGAQDGIDLRDCTFRNCRVGAGSVVVYAAADLESCQFYGHDGIVVRKCGAVSVKGCRFIEIQGTALHADHSSRVQVTEHTVMQGCTIGVNADDCATVALQDCMISGGDTAVSVYGSDCTVTAKRVVAGGSTYGVITNPDETGSATVKLVDSSVSGGTMAVAVGGYASGVVLLRCRVENSLSGVFASPGGTIRVKESRVSRCRNGVVIGRNEDCIRNAVGLVHVARKDAVARVTLSDVTVSESLVTGVAVHMHGCVKASGVTVRRCCTGFAVQLLVACNQFIGCRAVACATPAKGWRWQAASMHDLPVPETLPGIEAVPDEEDSSM